VTEVSELFSRKVSRQVEEALEDTRVVVINGARQTGKSTLAQSFAAQHSNSSASYLDSSAVRASATSDPMGFVRRDGLTIIDEVQRVPDLILAIKHCVDMNQRPGQFLLTASARLWELPDLPDSLIGRSETIELFPLAQGEIDGAPEGFVSAAIRDGVGISVEESTDTKRNYIERALRGGFPEAVRRERPQRRTRFFESYVADLIKRDVSQLSDIERPADLRRLIEALAAMMSGQLVPGRLANDLGLPATTVKRYIDLLELLYVVKRVPAWSSNLTTRAVSTPKLLFTDSGLAGSLAGWTLGSASNVVAPVGPLIENFVLGEIARQLPLLEHHVEMYHFRDRDGVEVDALLEGPWGTIVGIEVKAAETVRAEDFRGLRHIADRLGDRFLAGFVMYTGQQKLPFGEKLAAVPISAIWRTAAD
jgi:predicted AAA+ superfamily ATPase